MSSSLGHLCWLDSHGKAHVYVAFRISYPSIRSLQANHATGTKEGGQDLVGGLDVDVHRNYFGRQLRR